MFTNEDEFKKLPNDAVRAALLDIIEMNVPTKNYKLHIKDGSKKGDNYIGIVHRLHIEYTDDSSDENCKPANFGLFLKVPPSNLARREQFFARDCFVRESFIYDEFLPLLREFQISKGIVPEVDGFHEYSKCFKNLTNDLEEAVFMEDLALKGYQMNDRFDEVSVEMVKLVMRVLGKFHALSFALKDQWSDKFAKFRDLKEVFINEKKNVMFLQYINSLIDLARSCLLNEGDDVYYERIAAYFQGDTIADRMTKLVDGSEAEPYAVVCHGDCWNNNILFKYVNKQLVDAKLIDWQISRFASPVCDIIYYIFCCTTKTLRDKHYKDILDTYYNELTIFLQRLGSDANKLYPRSEFEDQLKRYGAFGLVMGLITIPAITTRAEDIEDLDEISMKMEDGSADLDEYLEKQKQNKSPRLHDMLVDMVEQGYV